MNHCQKASSHRPPSPAYRPAFERLSAAVAENTPGDNSEVTELLGRRIFGDLWNEPEQTSTAVFPK
jgi:hypothetical protein